MKFHLLLTLLSTDLEPVSRQESVFTFLFWSLCRGMFPMVGLAFVFSVKLSGFCGGVII